MKNWLKNIYTRLVIANVNREGLGYIANNGRGRASMTMRIYRAKTGKWEGPIVVNGGLLNKAKSLFLK